MASVAELETKGCSEEIYNIGKILIGAENARESVFETD
jgi:hypothetical protein